MLVVKLQGGLGNQMFQYASARSLLKPGKYLYLDHQFLENNPVDTADFSARKYELNIFKNLKAKKATTRQINVFKTSSKRLRYLIQFLKPSVNTITQLENQYVPFANQAKYKHHYLEGYFQSEQYFKHLRSEILFEFRFPELDVENERLKQNILNSSDATSLHIRRGDYVRVPGIAGILPLLPISYYEKALNQLINTSPTICIFIFSDDLPWVKENFKRTDVKITYVEHNQGADSWKDMALMSYCRHHIIANSSFSWWGAWLSRKEGQNYAPSGWFNRQNVNYQINDLVPSNWIIIDDY